MDVGFSNGAIKLNSSNNVYYSGQTITGDVTFKLLDTEKITALNIQFIGEAKVLWTEVEKEKRNGTTFKTRVDYKAQEQYFNNVQCLLGGQGVTDLRSGSHSIPFQYQIPITAPSSYKAEKGEILYEIRAYLEFSDVTKQRGELAKIFEVVAPLDLNREDPRIKEPLKLIFEESYGCGCLGGSGPLGVEVAARAGGACPGQRLPVDVTARNDTRVEVKAVELELLCKRQFRSHQPVADISTPEEVIASVKTGPVLAGVQRNYQLELIVPDMIAPNLANCSIMGVKYFFKATVKLSGCNNDLAETLPFYIGLRPVNDIGEYVHPMAHSLPSGPIPDYPMIANETAKPEMGFKVATLNENAAPPNQTNNTPINQNNYTPTNQSNYTPQYPGYNYNQPGFPNQPAPMYPVINYANSNPNLYVPNQFPGMPAPARPVNYSPSAPPM